MGRDERANLKGLPGGAPLFGAGGNRISTQPPEVRDAYNRALQVGDLCILPADNVSPFQVTKIAPMVDPNVPAGMMEVVLTCTVRFLAPRAQPQREFSRVMTVQERGEAPQEPKEKVAENFFAPDDAPKEPESVK